VSRDTAWRSAMNEKSPRPREIGAPSVLASWTRTIIRALDARGIDGRALAAHSGIDLKRLDDAEARYPMTATSELWRQAVAASGDPCLGLYVSRFVNYTTFHA